MKHTLVRTMITAMLIMLLPLTAQAAAVEDELRGFANALQKILPMSVSDEMQATSMTAAGKVLLTRYHYMGKAGAIPNIENLKNDFFSILLMFHAPTQIWRS